MKSWIWICGLVCLLAITSGVYAAGIDCDTNHIEDITNHGVLCDDILRAHWGNNKKQMCEQSMQKRLCCKFCKETANKAESKDVLIRRILEILESSH